MKTWAAGIGTRDIGKLLSNKFTGISTMRNQTMKQHLPMDQVQYPESFLI